MRSFLLIPFLLLLFSACSSDEKKTETFYHKFSNNAWPASEPIKFSFEVADTSMLYSITGKLRYKTDFTFSTLNLSASLSSSDGSIRKKKISLQIRNNDGEFNGSEQKDYREISFDVISSVKLNETGQWTLLLIHDMPVDINRGLEGIELNLNRAK